MSTLGNNLRAGAPLTKIVIEGEAVTREATILGEEPSLGALTELQGSWVGKGFNLIALPDFHNKKPFRLMLNTTIETLEFKPITAPIPNRGNTQDDITFLGLTYVQKVNDAITSETLHLESGMWLNLSANPKQPNASVVRMSTIPHGNSLLAQGPSLVDDGPPIIGDADATPFFLDANGNRVNDPNEQYLLPYKNAPLPPGIARAAVLNPNIILRDAIKAQEAEGRKVVRTVVLFVHATPVGGINGTTPPQGKDGGIVNIPFVVTNANANSMSAIFWIETVQNADGSQFMQLQYTQTVILDFPVIGANGQPFDIRWPHISVATMIKG
ncbi:MAG: heme-binding protein [Ferruginibacter sp.]